MSYLPPGTVETVGKTQRTATTGANLLILGILAVTYLE
jgi:hypothetical protein